jgi:endonuclease YncB( thermonuclease family)
MPIDVPPAIVCESPRAIDGDTIRCANIPQAIRLIGIDAPELPGHCRKGRICTPGDGHAARRALAALLATGPVLVHPSPRQDKYRRLLAHVVAHGRDLNCALLAARWAVRRYSAVGC